MPISLPIDANAKPMQMQPAKAALATTYDATISSSTEITLNANTSYIEVAAIDKAILMKWGTADASTSAFDHAIPLNTVCSFVVPTGVTAVNFIEQAATAILAMTEF